MVITFKEVMKLVEKSLKVNSVNYNLSHHHHKLLQLMLQVFMRRSQSRRARLFLLS